MASKRKKVFVGIDAGTTAGHIAVIDEDRQLIYHKQLPSYVATLTTKTKSGNNKKRTRPDEFGYKKTFEEVAALGIQIYCCVELLLSMPRFILPAWALSASYHMILLACAIYSFAYELVSSKEWQSEIFGGKGKTKDKSTSLMAARRLFPMAAHLLESDSDDGLADALCLAELAWRKHHLN